MRFGQINSTATQHHFTLASGSYLNWKILFYAIAARARRLGIYPMWCAAWPVRTRRGQPGSGQRHRLHHGAGVGLGQARATGDAHDQVVGADRAAVELGPVAAKVLEDLAGPVAGAGLVGGVL